MAQETKEGETGLLSSKYWRLLLVVLAGLFTFGSPYVVYLASSVLKRGVFFSFTGGFLSLVIGLLLLWYLVKNKVISWRAGNFCLRYPRAHHLFRQKASSSAILEGARPIKSRSVTILFLTMFMPVVIVWTDPLWRSIFVVGKASNVDMFWYALGQRKLYKICWKL